MFVIILLVGLLSFGLGAFVSFLFFRHAFGKILDELMVDDKGMEAAILLLNSTFRLKARTRSTGFTGRSE